MATLEKIRSKSVLLIVIIGVALLAFIIGDAITNSRNLFGDQSTVAKVGGSKIDYTDYSRKLEQLNSQVEAGRAQNPQQYANFDSQVLGQQAVEQLITEKLVDEAASRAGIRTTSNLLRYYVIDRPVNPVIRDIIMSLQNAGQAVGTPAQAYDVIFNPQNYGLKQSDVEGLQRAWVQMENETRQMVSRNTYQTLLAGTVKANELDKHALFDDYVNTRNVSYVFSPYGQLDPEKYVADEAALRSEYENVKNKYRVEELTKDVAFIAVTVNPSPEDRAAASALATETAKAMATPGGIGKDLRKEGLLVTQKEVLEKNLPRGVVREFVEHAPADSIRILNQGNKGFTIVKMGRRSSVVDSLKLNIVTVASETLAERVKSSLNGGLNVDSLASVFSIDSVSVQSGQWIPLYNDRGWTGSLDHSQVDTLLNAGGRYINMISTPGGVVMAKLVEKSSPKTLYEYQEVTYDLKPSAKTLTEATTKLEDFLTANPDSKSFIANAPEQNYMVQNLSLNASTPAVPNRMGGFYPDSRQVVRWVMIDGKPGKVSHVYDSKQDPQSPQLYAVAVVNQYEDYAPLANDEVNNFVANRVRRSQAGDELVQQYTPLASSVDNVAQAMKATVRNDSVFRFGNNSRLRDAAIMGKIAGSQPGNVVVVKGDNGVYAYQVLSTGVTEDFTYDQHEAQFARQYGQLVNPDFEEMLRGSEKVKNNIYKFMPGD